MAASPDSTLIPLNLTFPNCYFIPETKSIRSPVGSPQALPARKLRSQHADILFSSVPPHSSSHSYLQHCSRILVAALPTPFSDLLRIAQTPILASISLLISLFKTALPANKQTTLAKEAGMLTVYLLPSLCCPISNHPVSFPGTTYANFAYSP